MNPCKIPVYSQKKKKKKKKKENMKLENVPHDSAESIRSPDMLFNPIVDVRIGF